MGVLFLLRCLYGRDILGTPHGAFLAEVADLLASKPSGTESNKRRHLGGLRPDKLAEILSEVLISESTPTESRIFSASLLMKMHTKVKFDAANLERLVTNDRTPLNLALVIMRLAKEQGIELDWGLCKNSLGKKGSSDPYTEHALKTVNS